MLINPMMGRMSAKSGGEAHGTLTAVAAPTTAEWTCPKSGKYHFWFTNSNYNGTYNNTMTLNGTPLNTIGHEPKMVFRTAYYYGMCYTNLDLTAGDVVRNETYINDGVNASMLVFETTLDIELP